MAVQNGTFFSLATIHKPSRLCAVTAAAATCCNQVQHQTCTQTPVSEKSLSLILSSYRMFQKFCNFSAGLSIVSAAVKYLSNVSAVPNNCLSSVSARISQQCLSSLQQCLSNLSNVSAMSQQRLSIALELSKQLVLAMFLAINECIGLSEQRMSNL